MTTAGDILNDVSGLVDAVTELISGKAVEAILSLARRAGCQAEIDSAVDVIAHALTETNDLLAGIKEPLTQLGAVQGLAELVQSLVQGLEGLAKATGDELAAFGGAESVGQTLGAPLGIAVKVLGVGQAVCGAAPKPEDLVALQASIVHLIERLSGFKTAAVASGGA